MAAAQELCYKIGLRSSALFDRWRHAGRLDGRMVPTSLSGRLSSGRSSGLTGAWPLLATAAASWLSSLVDVQPRPRGTQLRGPAAQPVGGLWPLARSCAARTNLPHPCKSSRWTRRTDGRDGSRHTALSRSYCVHGAGARTPRVAKAVSPGSAHRRGRDGAVAPQAYCARPRLASVELRTCQPVNSHPLCRESSRSRSHSLDDQSV